VALVNETIEDRIGERGLPEVGVSGVHRQLARDVCRAGIDAIVEDFQQVRPILRRERGEAPVVEHDERRFGQAL
jgi:hypothetical protein